MKNPGLRTVSLPANASQVEAFRNIIELRGVDETPIHPGLNFIV